jgi:hypothetical protein
MTITIHVRRMRLIAACLALCIDYGTAFGQRTSTLAGTVTDSITSKPIADAAVIIRGTTLGCNADTAGRYTISRIPPGTYTVVASHVAYFANEYSLTIQPGVDTVLLNPSLFPTVLPLPGVTALFEFKRSAATRDSSYRKWARIAVMAKELEGERLTDFDQFLRLHCPLAENEYDLFVDGSRYDVEMRDAIGIHTIRAIFVWRRIDAPAEFRHSVAMPSRQPRKALQGFAIKPYIILIETK